MRIFNKDKSEELTNPDLESGFLAEDRLVTAHREGEPERVLRTAGEIAAALEAEGKKAFEADGTYYEVTAEYPSTGGRDVRKIEPEVAPAVPPRDEYEDILVYVPYTDEELEKRRYEADKARLARLTEDFAQAYAGAIVPNLTERRAEFLDALDRVRIYENKEPRKREEDL